MAVEVFSDVLALDTTTVTPRHTGGVTRLNDLLAAEGQLLLRTGNTIPGLSNDDPDFATAPTESTFNFKKENNHNYWNSTSKLLKQVNR